MMEELAPGRRFPHDMENVLASLADGVMVLNQEERLVLLNPALEQMAGLSAGRVLGRRVADLFPEDRSLAEQVRKTRTTGQSCNNLEHRFKGWGGRLLPVGVTTTPLLEGTGEVGGVVVVIRDLSRLRELEEVVSRAQRLFSLDVLSAAMAHEIKNPLGGIRGAAQLLRSELQGAGPEVVPLREYTDVIIKEVDRVNQLIEHLLDSARPRAMRWEEVNIHEVLNRVLRLERQEQEMVAANVALVQDYDPSLPPVSADRSQLVQLFLNLVRNGIEAMPEGGTLTISTKVALDYHLAKTDRPSPAAQVILVEVRDEGGGIGPAVRPKLFTPFFTTKAKGTGLGLAICHRIVEEHHGAMRLLSEEAGERGTVVQVHLPVRQ